MSRRRPAWRPVVRLAWRDALRAKGRNALVVAMIGVPVMLVVGLTGFLRTSSVSTVESLPRKLGSADALVTPTARIPVVQLPGSDTAEPADPTLTGGQVSAHPWTAGEVAAAAGGRVLPVRRASTVIRTARGGLAVGVREVDLTDPISHGLVGIVAGRAARTGAEVAVNPVFAARGFGIGTTVTLAGPGRVGTRRTVVGVLRDPTSVRRPMAFALPGAVLGDDPTAWSYLLDAGQPVTWSEVRRMNRLGLAVLSRTVVLHPPPAGRLEPGAVRRLPPTDNATGPVTIAVASVMLEVALLAGPAFAVGVQRRRRELALLAAAGGSPADLRRTVLAQALVLGAGGAVVSAALGVGLARVAVAAVADHVSTAFGPFEVRLTDVAVTVAVGAAAALLAAWLPARQAARTDVLAALTGRRAQTRSRRGWPVLGAVLAAAGAVLCLTLGARRGGRVAFLAARSDTIAVVAGMVLLILGAVLATPALVGLAGRLARRLPLPVRFATRDAARNRGRTAPAVAAVMAAVAGITTIAISSASLIARDRRDYLPQLPAGYATVWSLGQPLLGRTVADTVRRELPGRAVLELYHPTDPVQAGSGVSLLAPGCQPGKPLHCDPLPSLHGPRTRLLYDLLAADAGTVEDLTGWQLTAQQRRVLGTGGILVAGRRPISGGTAVITTYGVDVPAHSDTLGIGDVRVTDSRPHRLTAAVFDPAVRTSGGRMLLAMAVVSPATAGALGIRTSADTVIPPIPGPLSTAEQQRLDEAVRGVLPNAQVYVERGFTQSFTASFLALAIVGGLLVLVGTLSATGLALVDAGPDLATLGAVGAAPRTRRGMAAAQALVIGLLGALLGVAVGTVPGLAFTWQLTSGEGLGGTQGRTTVAIPWPLLAVVVLGTPLIAALGTALATRSRLPLTRRLAA